jgi:hypothetical protein
VLFVTNGKVAEWLKAADCKSVEDIHRRFESCLSQRGLFLGKDEPPPSRPLLVIEVFWPCICGIDSPPVSFPPFLRALPVSVSFPPPFMNREITGKDADTKEESQEGHGERHMRKDHNGRAGVLCPWAPPCSEVPFHTLSVFFLPGKGRRLPVRVCSP